MKALPAETVRLITSSQVITSVFSIVKELVENSLDANATSIEVKLENYGFDRIEIRDDGDGIPLDNVPYMAQQHFTSKISQMDDLHHLLTYGFRGEALASLCAVASVTIATKTDEDPISMVYTLDQQGKVTASKPCHLGRGTTVTAINLFKNTPVRKQFFSNAKRRKDELRKVEDLIMQFATIKPQTRFMLRNDKTIVLQKNKLANHKAALASVWGRNVIGAMQELSFDVANAKVDCFLPKPDADVQLISRCSNDRCWVFVNGRPVSYREIEKLTKHCISNSYPTQISGRYPFAFISISLPPDSIDVNLEPNKTKVLLHEKESILEAMECKLKEVYQPISKEDQENLSNESDRIVVESESNCTVLEPISSHTNLPSVPNVSKYPVNKVLSNSRKTSHGLQREVQSNGSVELECSEVVLQSERFPQTALSSSDCSVIPEEATDQSFLHKSDYNNRLQNLQKPCDEIQETLCKNVETSENSGKNSNLVRTSDIIKTNCTSETVISIEADSDNNTTADVLPLQVKDESGLSENADFIFSSELSDSALMDYLETKHEASLNESTIDGLHESVNKIAQTEWSKGKGLVDDLGRPVEPGKILVPTKQGNPSKNAGVESLLTPCREKKPKQVERMGDATFYNMVGKTPIKRPQTAYIFFCKEVRPQVIKDNPTADFQTISKLTGERWRALTEEEKCKYEDLMKQDVLRYKEQVQEAKKNGTMKEPVRKKKCIKQPPQQMLVDKLFSSPKRPTSTSPVVKRVDVNFSCAGLKDDQQHRNWDSLERLHLIGQLPNGFWICKEANQIQLLNHFRVEETLLYHRLLSEHRLQIQQLQPPITLLSSMIGGPVNWQTLLMLKSSTSAVDGSRTFVDERLVANGFVVKQTEDSEGGNVRLQVTGMATNIPCYSLADLAELLDTIGSSTNGISLKESRPVKLVHYLQAEAVRLARDRPHRSTHDNIMDMIEQRSVALPPNVKSCIHNKPFLKTLHTTNVQ
ncbi:PMS1 protein homolog 1-like [Antedon mediterranea]|uniref:PMS1 protein homolog 1-like n=1 Tax=Antedon mediterranea TaxID=105859 RepID=UPI003AF86891